MRLRKIAASWCGRVLLLGLAAAVVAYALLAVTGVARVSHRLPQLLKTRLNPKFAAVAWLDRPAKPQAGFMPNGSSRLITPNLKEKFRRFPVQKLVTEPSRPTERKEGINGRPLSERARRLFSDLTKTPFMEDPHYQPSTCSKMVSSLAQHSRWFGQRYKARIKLFLDDEDFDNFTNISKHVPPFGYAKESKELFKDILKHPKFTNAPVNGNGTRKQCLRCAVVGCGGILKDSGAGREIDSHDYVFRLNHAVTTGRFARDVGIKTSFYIFFPESMSVQNTLDKNSKFIYTVFKTYDMKYAVTMLDNENPPPYIAGGQIYPIPKPNIDPAKLKIVHPDFFRYVFAEYLDAVAYRPTTGAMVVFLALHMCDEVTIYGFGYDPHFTMHYYDNSFVRLSDVSTGSHDVDNERHLWDKLHQEGVIRLFKRDV